MRHILLNFYNLNYLRLILFGLILLFSSFNTFAQRPDILNRGNTTTPSFGTPQPTPRTVKPFGNKLFEEKKDTSRVIIPDSLKSKDTGLQSTVQYIAQDSTVMDVDGQTVHLYGQAKVTYGDVVLEADYIKLDWGKNEIYAHGSPDTTKKGEKVKGKPIFSQSGDKYNTDTIRYNFKSRKAIIKGIVTQQGEGFVQGQKVKKDAEDNLYLVNAKYTTCNLKEPHYHIAARKIKLVNKKQVISGPFNFVLNNIPLPIGLPFGFFPVPKKKELGTSGIIMGSYGEEPQNRGFYFRDFGYYFAISERIGMKILGQIYSKGSWGAGIQSNYSRRYKYNGNLNFQFNNNKLGAEVVDPTSSRQTSTKDFNLSWAHSPANRRPDRSFSSSVNLMSNGFNRNNRRLDQVDMYTNNAFGSSVQYTRNFGKNFRTSTSFRVDQNVSTKVMNSSVDYSLGLNQFNPFVPEKKQIGRWYESFRVGIDVSGGFQFTNTLVSRITNYTEYKVVRENNDGTFTSLEARPLTEEELRLQALGQLQVNNVRPLTSLAELGAVLKDGQFRTTYSVPVTLPNFKIARYINFTPSISYRGEIFTKELNYRFIPEQNAVAIDTTTGVFNAYQWSVSGSMNTRIYGTYQLKGKGRLQAIRHTMAPSISIGYSPDLKDKFFVHTQIRKDEPNPSQKRYLPKYTSLGGSPGASGNVGFNLTNQLEAKLKSKSDTATKAFEKISLLDNLSLSTNYNLLADSMNLSEMSLSANTNLFKGLVNINMGGSLDPYFYQPENTAELQAYNPAGRKTRYYKWQKSDGFATIRYANISIGTRFTPETFNKNKTKPKATTTTNDPAMDAMKKFVEANPDLYVDFSVPWSLSLSYNLGYNKQGLAKAQIVQALSIQGDLSLTAKWKIGFNTGWDFQFKAATLTNISINRELHCWDMSFNWTPIAGNNLRASNYSFDLRVRSSLLQELKVSRRRQYYDRGGF